MALIDCPECGHKVSDQADACPSCGRRLTDRLDKLELETELNRIDLEWEQERKNHMLRGLGGSVVPNRARAVAHVVWGTVILVVMFGIFIVALPEVVGEGHKIDWGGMLAFFGMILFIVLMVAVFKAMYVFEKAADYERAEAEYQQRREAAKAKYEAEDQTQPKEPSP